MRRDDVLAEVERVTAELLAAHRAEQAGWESPTDCDRLDEAFATLNRLGIVARQDFSCCTPCGHKDIWQEIARRRKATCRGLRLLPLSVCRAGNRSRANCALPMEHSRIARRALAPSVADMVVRATAASRPSAPGGKVTADIHRCAWRCMAASAVNRSWPRFLALRPAPFYKSTVRRPPSPRRGLPCPPSKCGESTAPPATRPPSSPRSAPSSAPRATSSRRAAGS